MHLTEIKSNERQLMLLASLCKNKWIIFYLSGTFSLFLKRGNC